MISTISALQQHRAAPRGEAICRRRTQRQDLSEQDRWAVHQDYAGRTATSTPNVPPPRNYGDTNHRITPREKGERDKYPDQKKKPPDHQTIAPTRNKTPTNPPRPLPFPQLRPRGRLWTLDRDVQQNTPFSCTPNGPSHGLHEGQVETSLRPDQTRPDLLLGVSRSLVHAEKRCRDHSHQGQSRAATHPHITQNPPLPSKRRAFAALLIDRLFPSPPPARNSPCRHTEYSTADPSVDDPQHPFPISGGRKGSPHVKKKKMKKMKKKKKKKRASPGGASKGRGGRMSCISPREPGPDYLKTCNRKTSLPDGDDPTPPRGADGGSSACPSAERLPGHRA
ncbi:unnamed protein product [Diplocarpon coronariae]